MSFEFFAFFCFTVFIASIVPGPSMMLALTHGIKYGFKKTFATASGNVSATFIQAVISVSGLSVILTTSDTIFHIIKWLGALYLIYLGFGIFFSKIEAANIKNDTQKKDISSKHLFMQAFFVAFGNPKAIVFFTALFPQFISVDNATIPQFVLLISSLCLIAFICILIYGYFGRKISDIILNTPSFSKLLGRITGISFMGAGLAIIFDD